MALVECRECQTKVSSKAKKCPHCGIGDPGRSSASHTVPTVVLLLIVILILARCGGVTDAAHNQVPIQNTPSQAAVVERSPSSHSSISTKSVKYSDRKIEVSISTEVTGGAFPLVAGDTNLPDGTVLNVQLVRPYPACYGNCPPDVPATSKVEFFGGRVKVLGGKFSAGPMWKNGYVPWPRNDGKPGLHEGTYILEVRLLVDIGAIHNQPANVIAALGPHNVNLKGPLVGGCCLDTAARYGQELAQKEFEDNEWFKNRYGSDVYYARLIFIS